MECCNNMVISAKNQCNVLVTEGNAVTNNGEAVRDISHNLWALSPDYFVKSFLDF